MMKRTIILIVKVLFLLVGILCILDTFFTTIYYQVDGKTKVDWVRNLHNKHFDYVVFGSSRVKYHIDIEKIEKITGMRGLNLGESDQGLVEIYLMIETFYKNNNTADRVFIQVDDNWNNSEPNTLGSSYFMPFIYESIYRDFYSQYNSHYWADMYIPFYRYMRNASSIGLRNIVLRTINEKSETDRFGYKRLNGHVDSSSVHKKILNPAANNELIFLMTTLVNRHSSMLSYFSTPTLEYNETGFDFLYGKLSDYKNFSSDSKYKISDYYDQIHLNKKGVEVFMEDFIGAYFRKDYLITVSEGTIVLY